MGCEIDEAPKKDDFLEGVPLGGIFVLEEMLIEQEPESEQQQEPPEYEIPHPYPIFTPEYSFS